MTWDEYKQQCYYLGRYADVYQRQGTFSEYTTNLIQEGMQFQEEQGIAYLEDMIAHGPKYQVVDQKLCPILLYTGDPICYGVLDGFAKALGYALDRAGANVEFYDLEAGGMQGLADFTGKRFKAIIGFQTYGFSVLSGKEERIHDLMDGPKFHMLLDHPVWLKNQLEHAPKKDYYILTHDRNYCAFIQRYYPWVKGTFLLPPGGEEWTETEEKCYDITFVGSYHDWRLWIPQVWEMNRKTHGVARHFLQHMLHHRDETWEDGLRATLQEMGREPLEDGAFLQLLFDIKPVCFVVMSYIREQIMDAIVDAGVKVHVFGDSWKQPRYCQAKALIRHGNVTPEESLKIYAQSKISLNIMSWHKDGMTERIANMMLNRAVVVTDESGYLREHYTAGQDYVPISIWEPERVPKILTALLEDETRQKEIAESAYLQAKVKETWDVRSGQFLGILGGISEDSGISMESL